jgi:hypothetical protein
MKTQIDGNRFIVTMPLTRFKVSIVSIILIASIWTPWKLLGNAKEELSKQSPNVQTTHIKNVISPYAFSESSKAMLELWLLYGAKHGHGAMLKRYAELTKNDSNYQPFLSALEAEWRLGRWDLAPKSL